MAININVNGESINYPQTGDTNWSDEATDFAVQTASALGKIGLSSGTTVDISGTLDVTGNTTLDANLSVTGNATITGNLTANGNSNLGNASGDTIAVTGILNVDSGVLYVNPTSNQVGINKTNPSQALDVTGNVAITGNETVSGTLNVTGATNLSSTLGVTGDVAINTNKFNITATSGNTIIAGTLGVTGDVAVNTNKFNVTASSGNTTIAGTLGVTSDITTSGILTASNSTNVTTAPPITFTGDTNTGIGHSAADTLDFTTGGVPRARINSTGQQSSTVPDLSGSNTTLYPEYKCRAWVNFNGTGSTGANQTIRGSGNVSSVFKNGTGNYTINIDIDMPDANYSAVVSTKQTNNDVTTNFGDIAMVYDLLAGSFRMLTCVAVNGNKTDPIYCNAAVFR